MSNEALKEAQDAIVCLFTFNAVVSLLEGGSLPGGKGTFAANRIIEICKKEQQRLLKDYDKSMAKVKP